MQLALHGRPAAHQVARALFRFGRDGDHHELAVAVVAGQLFGVVAVVFALVPGPPGRERGGADVAVVAPALDRALQDVARATRLVHAAQLGAVAREPVEVALQAAEIVRQRIDLPRRHRVIGLHGTDHRLLVHVEAEIENSGGRRRHGLALLVV